MILYICDLPAGKALLHTLTNNIMYNFDNCHKSTVYAIPNHDSLVIQCYLTHFSNVVQ